ncbi:MAG: ABC transporter permease subunit [Nevskiaceae bacterium]|nr:MAG: ABC transporter permease subunit [Nevskiaceae bacterium]TBR73272.1 MAG: ABC transporter permease subunit [Nevskiaceae bacterium]
MLVVFGFSFTEPNTFRILQNPSFKNYQEIFQYGYYQSLLWSFGLSLIATAISFALMYPIAFGMAKIFKRFALIITVIIVIMLFVAEDTRMFGWDLSLMRGGMLMGPLQEWFGLTIPTPLNHTWIIVFGLFYSYSPFMLYCTLYGLSMVPDEIRAAARDLGASRARVLFEIDLPLAMPGIVVGWLLTFALSVGAIASAKLLARQSVIVAAQEIETAFNYSQNWPLGAALVVLLVIVVASVAFYALGKIDLDGILGVKK